MSDIEKAARVATARDSSESLKWFHDKIKGSYMPNGRAKGPAKALTDATFKVTGQPIIGGLYFFIYDAKHKDTLPWFDAFPCVIPIQFYNDGFLGLNLHYVQPIVRARVLDTLKGKMRKSKTSQQYMQISYNLLTSALKSDVLSKCIHRYLSNHIQSDIVMVDSVEWKKAALMPVQSFVGATAQQVWRS